MSKGNLKELMSFPAIGYSKLNGYLGMVSLNKFTNELYITSKSNVKGIYAEMIKGLIHQLDATKLMYLKNYLKKNDVTLTFEVIKVKEDPHIIEYEKDKLVLLSIVDNNVVFNERPYEEVVELGNKLGLEVTEPLVVLNSWEEFKVFYKKSLSENVFDLEEEHIEGYVIKCSNGFFVKLKMPYYSYWKSMRGNIEKYKKGNEKVLVNLNKEEQEIVKYGAEKFKDTEVNIIDLLNEDYIKKIVNILNQSSR